MDRKLYTDDFERLLREKSDEFRMYPSRRIWNSIYNNIHPGKKWPSVAMCITLITALLLVGYLNTKNNTTYSSPVSKNNGNNLITQNSKAGYQLFPEFTSVFNNHSSSPNSDNSSLSSVSAADNVANTPSDLNKNPGDTNTNNLPVSPVLKKGNNAPNKYSGRALVFKSANDIADKASSVKVSKDRMQSSADYNNTLSKAPANNILINEMTTASLMVAEPFAEQIEITDASSLNKQNINKDLLTKNEPGNAPVEKRRVASIKQSSLTDEEKVWIEDYAFHNKPAAKKWAGKLAWQVYATPSVVYRKLHNNAVSNNPLNSVPFANAGILADVNNSVNHRPSIGLETGAALQYSIFKGVKIKAGLQLNYTRYNAVAFQNTHPVATQLTLNDFRTNQTYEVYRNTPFSNNSGLSRTHLHNETYQVSIPLGIELKLAGKDNLQWNVATTIQPTYLIGARSYLISSDRRNYVKESSMLNRWNMNAGFETFVSYKHNGFTWQFGPHFRTQLFSTNSRLYTVEEKLVNYGFKVGVSKTIQ